VYDAVKTVFEDVAASFGAGDLARYRQRIATPCVVVSPAGTQVLHDDAEFNALFTPMMQRLKAQGFARSVFERFSCKQLAPNMALASMHWTRYRADGTPLETLGATYTLMPKDGYWQIVVLMPHAADSVPAIG
jgi:ketosteroid isomerase-like protein